MTSAEIDPPWAGLILADTFATFQVVPLGLGGLILAREGPILAVIISPSVGPQKWSGGPILAGFLPKSVLDQTNFGVTDQEQDIENTNSIDS